MKPATLAGLALAGSRTDTVRVVLTALSATLATLAGLAALTVLAIPTPICCGDRNYSEQYSNALLREPGLRGGTAFALLLLTIPVLALAGQCARLGAPARDRRLAALRLAGATPGQVTWIAVAETGLASLLGTSVGLATYLGGRQLLHRPDEQGRLALATDVLPPTSVTAAVVIGLPLVAALASALLLRPVSTTPFGLVRTARRERPPRPWSALLIPLALAAFTAVGPILRWYEQRQQEPPDLLLPSLVGGGALAAMLGVVISAGWLSYVAGKLLHRYARGPAALLAAARLIADPWAGSRTFAALLATILLGAGAAGLRSWFHANNELIRLSGGELNDGEDFYLGTMDLVDLAVTVAVMVASGGLVVALVEGIAARRRANAALVAAGVPRGTIGRSIAWQALAPTVPAVGLALAVGTLLARGLFPAPTMDGVTVTPDVPVPQLAWIGAGALAAVLITVGVGLLFLRASTAVEELRAG
ncbi:FtsX-like permease family protein [Micromonospora sp. KC606]|uniref:FtsX-like permease family protein n=1 Tax=Micromonospora sp. KC606 TaxID=2530379 RepID=UPI001051A9C1|nr:FtsX-like permease family protein [Micromonospora sp. KC606]TDC82043.1 FtsX-like permease family protein [Micromonospora sp. KC606]